MALNDNLLVKIQPAAGDTFIKNLIGDTDAAGSTTTGTITLQNDAGLYGWRIVGERVGTFLNGTNYEGGAVTMAVRFKANARAGNFSQYVAVKGDTNSFGPRIQNAGSSTGSLRATENLGGGGSTTIGNTAYTTGQYITIVIRCRDNGFEDGTLSYWKGTTGRTVTTPDASVAASSAVRSNELFNSIYWGAAGEDLTFVDMYVWQRGLTDAEAAAVADDIRTVMNGGGTPVDTTAPNLTSPSATATGTTTASGVVTTDDPNGTLYWITTLNSNETATTVKAGSSQNVTAAGQQSVLVSGLSSGSAYYLHFLHRNAVNLDSTVVSAQFTTPSVDTTPPTLTNPSGSATGPTTSTGSVTTNEGAGTLWALCSTNSTETAATIKSSGTSQAVTSTGTKTASATGLTASTTYYWHFVQDDAASPVNTSIVSNSGSFVTGAPADTTPPTLSSATATKTGSTTASWSVSTNEGNGTLYVYFSTNASETVATVKASGSLVAVTSTGTQVGTKTGLTPSTQYRAHFVHTDSSGNNDATATSTTAFNTDAPAVNGVITWPFPIVPKNGTPRKGEGHRIVVCHMTTDAVIVRKTSLVANAVTGVPPAINDATIVPGTTYRCHLILDGDNNASGTEVITAT